MRQEPLRLLRQQRSREGMRTEPDRGEVGRGGERKGKDDGARRAAPGSCDAGRKCRDTARRRRVDGYVRTESKRKVVQS